MRGLYPLLDLDVLARRRLDALAVARAILVVRPPLVQLRAKSASAREVLGLARELVPLCAEHGAELCVNDRPDLALLSGAPWVHVGQDDLPIGAVRALGPLKVGVSTHDLGQLDRALAERPDYVAFGPVFATRSKAQADPVVGLPALAEAGLRARAAGVPLVAIGGIDLPRAVEVAPHAALGAVIAALYDVQSATEVTSAALALHRALQS